MTGTERRGAVVYSVLLSSWTVCGPERDYVSSLFSLSVRVCVPVREKCAHNK